ncbi:MAG: sigma-54 dependent transcriptional regulator [Mariprofundaceae bacterium]
MTSHIMIVDDEAAIRESLQGLLEDEGYQVSCAPSGEEAVVRFRKQPADCLLLDIWMPGIDGLETMTRIHQINDSVPIIIMSGHATIDTAVRATRQGAFDFLEKPLSSEKLLILLRNALEKRKLKQENTDLKQNIQQQSRQELIGNSTLIKNTCDLIRRVAASDAPALILGEHGTGKAVAARLLHTQSKRSAMPFVEVNTASTHEAHMDSELFGHEKGAFPGALHAQRGRFETADGGFLFLDEIGELSMGSQAKILRAMQEKKLQRLGNPQSLSCDVRVIGASVHNPEKLLANDTLREDFYYRLNVVTIQMPSLKERIDDLPILVDSLASEQANLLGGEPVSLSENALEVMRSYAWGGNVRELRNYIERCHILLPGEIINLDNMPPLDVSQEAAVQKAKPDASTFSHSFHDAKDSFERNYLLHHLEKHDWNISRTAADIGMERSQLHRKLKNFKLNAPEKPS